MQLGYATTFQNPGRRRPDRDVWDDEVALSELAIKVGFNSIWSTEHHFTDYEMIPNPLQFLSFMAGRAPTARLGTMVVVLPWHDPIRVASEVAVLDNLCAGRFILGIGRGLAAVEFDAWNIDMSDTRDMFNQAAEIVLNALENGFIEANTAHYKIPRRDIRPEPIYSFKGRTYGAGGSTASMPIMARLGAGLLLVPVNDWKQVESDLALYKKSWEEFHPGRPRPKPLLDQFIYCDTDRARAEDTALKHLEVYLSMVLDHYNLAGAHFEKIKGYEQYASTMSKAAADAKGMIATFAKQQAWGTPDEVIAKLQDGRARTDPSSVLAHFCFGGMPRATAEASIKLFGERVAPVVRAWEPDPFANLTPLPSRAKEIGRA
ncbi:MAG: LLM class flavin-dependent oxidoreductase, partial [Hyphomonadaceae bacterium]